MCERRELLLEYLYDEASPEARRDVERHLEGCDDCRDEIRAFRNVREDLLAWGVPNPPSVWTAFAPAAAVPWHKQVPAWAMAAAASVMLVVGSAGGFLAHSVVEGTSPDVRQSVSAPVAPVQLTQASVLDSKAILSIIREELSHARREVTGRAIPINDPSALRLDPKAEARIMTRVSELVNASLEHQNIQVYDYLVKVKQEDDRLHTFESKRMGSRLTGLSAEVEQLKAQVSQLLLAQAKGQ